MDHSHAGHDHGTPHAAAPGAKQEHPSHGSYIGHAIPGTMFIVWSTYWLWSILDIHLRRRHLLRKPHASHSAGSTATTNGSSNFMGISGSSSRRQFTHPRLSKARQPNLSWYPWPFAPLSYLEPLLKVVFPLLGVLVELWIGWGFHWRPMFERDGHFAEFHINNWQHAMMYGSFALSGMVELLGVWVPLPDGTEQGFLSLAFLSETLLMGLHTKHNPLDALVHHLLTWLMLGCAGTMAAEAAVRNSMPLALAKTLLVFLQGTWFWHVGRILYLDNWAWDMNAMSSVMFIPVVFSLHIMAAATFFLTVYVVMRVTYAHMGWLPRSDPKHAIAHAASAAGELELADMEWGDDGGWQDQEQEGVGLLAGDAMIRKSAAVHRAHH